MGDLKGNKPIMFAYNCGDFHFKCSNSPSKFDATLCERWDHAMEQGFFKYNLDSVERKIIPGNLGFVAQLNEKRFTQRRQPQHITSLSQPFDAEKFNFTKVNDKEILATLCAEHRDDDPGRHIIVINISPLEYGNILFVPNADAQLPQVLTEEAISLSMELVLLSSKRDFRIGFNSLCAFASVNHLHLHAFYSPYVLPVENTKVSCASGGFYETVDYPIKAFVFECSDARNVTQVARLIHKVTSYLHKIEVAHNVFITRGQQLTETVNTAIEVLRIFIWARKPSVGIKNENVFNIAVCELGGFLPIRERSWYDNMTEDNVCNYLRKAALEEEQYKKIRSEISEILAIH